ncbi:MAG: hypothetical protein IPM29_11835 [Planctomycetes bacterium]|nr:hypothetical protein [Planctomycetota bacterium]
MPTAGYTLEREGIAIDVAGIATVQWKLTTPGADELVAQVLQTLADRVPLPTKPRAVIVRVSTWQRGVEYFVAPEPKVAAVLDGPR